MQCELEGRESSSGCLVDGWPEGSRVQQTMGRGRRPLLSIWQLTRDFLKRPNQPAHIWCFSQFLQWCRHYRQEWECRERQRRAQQEVPQVPLELSRTLWKCSREAPDAPGKQPWAWQGWACGWTRVGCGSLGVPWSVDRVADGSWYFSAPKETDEQWAGQLAGKITWSPWFASSSERVAWEARGTVRTLVFCS